MKKYDFLVVGAGLYGATFAHEAKARGKSVLVIDKRSHIAGNVYTEEIERIHVHKYGAHIFHTNNEKVWRFVNRFASFNRFTNSPMANYRGKLFSLPFNMYTFNQMWGVTTPEEAASKIEEQRKEITHSPTNLEEQAISMVGRDVYETLVKGYTEKQWGRKCTELPAFIIKRLPVRFTYDNNYFNDLYQGIPIGGYTKIVEKIGAYAPGKEIFAFEVYDFRHDGKVSIVSNTVETDGEGKYYGDIVIEVETEDIVLEGFLIREIKGGKARWSYSDSVWEAMPVFDPNGGWTGDFEYTIIENGDPVTYGEAFFVNKYYFIKKSTCIYSMDSILCITL